jgi:hypothetical protein
MYGVRKFQGGEFREVIRGFDKDCEDVLRCYHFRYDETFYPGSVLMIKIEIDSTVPFKAL